MNARRVLTTAWAVLVQRRLGVILLIAAVTVLAFQNSLPGNSGSVFLGLIPLGYWLGAVTWWAGMANLPLLPRLSGWTGAVAAAFASRVLAHTGAGPNAPWSVFKWIAFSGDASPLIISPAAMLLSFLALRHYLVRRGVELVRIGVAEGDGHGIASFSPRARLAWDVVLLIGVLAYAVGLLLYVQLSLWWFEFSDFAADHSSLMAQLLAVCVGGGIVEATLVASLSWAALAQDRPLERLAMVAAACVLYVIYHIPLMLRLTDLDWSAAALSSMGFVPRMIVTYGGLFVLLRLAGYRFMRRARE